MDVFLSFRNTDDEGNFTKDKEMAEELYRALVEKGIAVFFSPHTLAELGASRFKEAIDEALDAASVLVAVGTSAENLNSNWVRYEWDGFCEDVLGGRKKGRLLSYIDGMPSQNPGSRKRTAF